MKKFFTIFFIPFVAFAETCEELKTQAMSNITSSESLLSDNSRYIQITYQNITALGYTLDTLDQRTSGDPYVNTARGQVSSILQGVQLVEQNENTISNDLFIARSLLSSIDCSCDETGTCPCDFSDIIQLLTSISSSTSDTYIELQAHGLYLSQIDDSITQITTVLETGFGDVTNILQNSFSVITNQLRFLLGSSMTYPSSVIGNTELGTYYLKKNNNTYASKTWAIAPSGLIPTSANGWLRIFQWFFGNVGSHLVSYENYAYDFERKNFPILTNTVGSISKGVSFITNELVSFHEDTTNFFSFFRGEIGVEGVLEDWTNVEADGTYHDFLTNHYINVVRHGSLSGYSYEKTNWFSRVETLLAALVFRDEGDTTGTNLVDGTRYDTEKQQINEALQDSISYLGAPVGKLQNMTEPLVSQLSVFSDAFSNAILPSHITIFSIGEGASRSSSVTPFDVTFMVDSEQQSYYQIIRSCTTLCWVFVSLLLIYWFLVWSINKIIVIVRFFWNVGEMFMSRNG